MPSIKNIQKRKQNELQQQLLNPIVNQNRDLQQYGEPYVYAKAVKQMEKFGLISAVDAEEMYFAIFKMELLRQILKDYRNKCEKEYEIDTSGLFIGMIVKNYSELCNILGCKAKTGKARQLQEKEFLRFFDYEKMKYSNEYIIMDIYDEPIPTGAKGCRNSLFVNQLKVLILKELSEQEIDEEGNIIYMTSYSRLIRKLSIVNEYFYKETSKFFVAKFPDLFSFDDFQKDYKRFKSRAFRKIKSNIQYALTALKKDNMITLDEYNVVGINRDDGTTVFHRATTSEDIYISTVKKDVSNQMGYRNSQVACFYQEKEFYNMISQRYKKEKGWDIVYYQLKIGANQRILNTHINEYTALTDNKCVMELSGIDLNRYRLEYNSNLYTELSRQAEEMKEKKLQNMIDNLKKINDEISEVDNDVVITIFQLNENEQIQQYGGEFPKRQKILIDYLVNLDAEKVNEVRGFIANVDSIKSMSKEMIPELDCLD